MDSNSSYFFNRLNEAILKSNLQPTIKRLQMKFDQISRAVKNVEDNHEIIRANISETKLNLKKREEMFWKRSVEQATQNGDVSLHNSDDESDLPSPDAIFTTDSEPSNLIESKMSGLQIDLSVLTSPERRLPSLSDGEVSCGSPEVVCINTPSPPADSNTGTGIAGMDKTESVISQGCELSISLNDRVLVMRKDKNWHEGIVTNSTSSCYSVHGDGFIEKSAVRSRLCPFTSLIPSHLKVGTRIVALYGQLEIYYAGVAAETPCVNNGERVLVFFDDGFAQYLNPNNVYIVANSSSEVWEEVRKLSRDFIKDYLSLYPKRPMLRLRPGDEIVTELRGKWCKPRVTDVDCSLARVHFVEENMKEWIYRGSTRFKLLFNFSTSHTEPQLITKNKHIITQMLYDLLCPPCLEAAETNTGIMESPGKLSESELFEVDQLRSEENEPSSSTLQTDSVVDSMVDRMMEELEDDRDDYSTEENYISPEVSDHDSESTYQAVARTNLSKSVPVPVPVPPPVQVPVQVPVPTASHDLVSLVEVQNFDDSVRKTRAKWKNINISNIVKTPRTGWEPGTIASTNSLQAERLEQQKAVLYNNHSYYTSSEYNEAWDRQAIQNSMSFWLDETAKLEHELSVKEENAVERICSTQNFAEVYILAEHSYSKLSSFNRPKQPKKFSKRIVIGNSSIKVSRKSVFEDEAVSNEPFSPHICDTSCAITTTFPSSLQPINSLSIPIFLGWKRELNFVPHKCKPAHAYYIAPNPCRRRMRSLDEIEYYLHITQTKNVSIDMFTLDTSIDLENKVYHLDNPKIFFGDLTMGVERIPIPFVNEIDTRPLPPLQYTTKRICYDGVDINTDPDFMICCDCTDDCQDKQNCSCCQLTAEVSRTKDFYGYQNRRLTSNCGVAIYECNSRCKCSSNCSNRVIQNGIQVLLQVFKTENKGWGIKCLNDIPKGSFICTYAGHIYNDELANELGVNLGDDYLAELDYLDVMETKKQGYEPYYGALLFSDNSDEREADQIKTAVRRNGGMHQEICDNLVILPEIEGDFPMVSMRGQTSTMMDIGRDVILLDSHSDDTDSSASDNQNLVENVAGDNHPQTLMINMVDPDADSLIESTKLGMIEERFPREWCNISLRLTNGDVSLAAEMLERTDKIVLASSPNSTDNPELLLLAASRSDSRMIEAGSDQTSEGDFPFIAQVCGSYPQTDPKQPIRNSPDIFVISDEDEFADFPASPEPDQDRSLQFHNDSIYLTPDSIPPNACLPSECDTYKNIRSLYEEKGAYVMDAKFVGNIGRYFNHSCQPNIFTHTVFLDTHDLRFPWVAFFAKKRIKANTELTWDYNYEIGSVPNKVLRCLCGTPKCRGRLL